MERQDSPLTTLKRSYVLDAAAGSVDRRGYSLADCLNRVDEGSAGGPALPGGTGVVTQMARAEQRQRLKQSYSMVVKHELDKDHRSHMAPVLPLHLRLPHVQVHVDG